MVSGLLLTVAPVVLILYAGNRFACVRDALRVLDCVADFSLALIAVVASSISLAAALRPKSRTCRLLIGACRWGRRRFGPLFLAGCLVLFLCPLYSTWAGHPPGGRATNFSAIGGIIPYSDARHYFEGAHRLLLDGTLDEADKYRPLSTCDLAVRLGLAGLHLKTALVLQSLFLGLAAALASRTLMLWLGVPAGLAFLSLALAFGRLYVPLCLSESLGLALGCLALALLWNGFVSGKRLALAAGLCALTFALSVRPGALAVLPLLAVAAALRPGRPPRFNWRTVGLLVATVAAGVVVAYAPLLFYKGPRPLNSHFSTVLYGVATGGQPWQETLRDLPHNPANETQADYYRMVYRKTWERIRERPGDFVKGYLKLMGSGLSVYGDFLWNLLADPILSSLRPLSNVLRCVMLISAVWVVWMLRRTPATWAFVVAAAGMILFLPFLCPTNGTRFIAATFPFLAVFPAFALPDWRWLRLRRQPRLAAVGPTAGPIFVFALWLLLTIAGPGTLRAFGVALLRPPPPMSAEPLDSDNLLFHTGRGVETLRLTGSPRAPSFSPLYRRDDFLRLQGHPVLRAMTTNDALAIIYDHRHRQFHSVIAPAKVFDEPAGFWTATLTQAGKDGKFAVLTNAQRRAGNPTVPPRTEPR